MQAFTVLALIAVSQLTTAIPLDVNSADSIKEASSTLAFGLMSWYSNNQSDTQATLVGTFPGEPWYWWEAGAIWGGLVDYWAYTGDSSYNEVVTQAILAQTGPDNNFMPPAYFGSLGNDDQAFWAFAALNAAEYNFPAPSGKSSSLWTDLAAAAFNTMVPRWSTEQCEGGLQWQVFKSNPGWGYKNSVSNGGFFQMAARLAKMTGNDTYVDWSNKIWDWMEGVGFIDKEYNVFDGAGSDNNCTGIDTALWTYNPSMLLYGAAVLANHTGDEKWAKRTSGLMTACQNTFFTPFPNATDVMFERQCEPSSKCNHDQYSFKAYLARWIAQTAVAYPAVKDTAKQLLTASAQAAAQSCSGGTNGTVCGQKWYIGGYDGIAGYGQQLSALETVQALLLLQGVANTQDQKPAQKPTVQDSADPPTIVTNVVTVTTVEMSYITINKLANSAWLIVKTGASA